jgi:stress response protein YsnF
MVTTATTSIDWNDVIKKEARGSGDEDLGEVQEVHEDYVLVQRGMVNKEKFYIPKDQAESYDGHTLRFRISEEEAKSRFMGDYPPTTTTSSTTRATADEGLAAARKVQKTLGESQETTVPVREETLDVSKRESKKEATITKKPVTETKTVEVPVTHEEISVERKAASGGTAAGAGAVGATAAGAGAVGATSAGTPVESEEEIRVPLKQEEVQVAKKPYVKEEVSVKKKPITETRTVTDQVRGEEVKVKGASGEEEEETDE